MIGPSFPSEFGSSGPTSPPNVGWPLLIVAALDAWLFPSCSPGAPWAGWEEAGLLELQPQVTTEHLHVVERCVITDNVRFHASLQATNGPA